MIAPTTTINGDSVIEYVNEREHTYSYIRSDGTTMNLAVLHGSKEPRLEIASDGQDINIPANMIGFLKDFLNNSEEVALLKQLLNSPDIIPFLLPLVQ